LRQLAANCIQLGLSLSAGTELNDCTVSFGFLSQCPAVIAEKLNAKQLDKAMAELDKNGKYGCEPCAVVHGTHACVATHSQSLSGLFSGYASFESMFVPVLCVPSPHLMIYATSCHALAGQAMDRSI
jgi:hypothetical protein